MLDLISPCDLETAIPPSFLHISAHPVALPLIAFNSPCHGSTHNYIVSVFLAPQIPLVMRLHTLTNFGVDPTKPFYTKCHDSTSCSSSLTGYPTVPKNLSPLVPTPTHSPNYMLPTFLLNWMITEEGTSYSDMSVTKYQQRSATSRKSEGNKNSGIYKL